MLNNPYFWVFLSLIVIVICCVAFYSKSEFNPNYEAFKYCDNDVKDKSDRENDVKDDADEKTDATFEQSDNNSQKDGVSDKAAEVCEKARVLKYIPRKKKGTVKKMELNPRTGHGSRREALCCKILKDIYGKEFVTVRPDFLKNPETGYNLEIDCYNDELKIGLEFSGIQHYRYPNYTGQSKEEFISQVRRDMFKVEACDRAGVYLITVPYDVPECDLKDFITYYLPENVAARQTTAPKKSNITL